MNKGQVAVTFHVENFFVHQGPFKRINTRLLPCIEDERYTRGTTSVYSGSDRNLLTGVHQHPLL